MENWIIVGKLAILGYCILRYVNFIEKNTTVAVLFALAYVSMNITVYIVRKTGVRKMLLAFSALLLVGAYWYLHPLFLLLLPIGLYELVHLYGDKPWVALIIVGVPAFWFKNEDLIEYALVALLSFFIYRLAYTFDRRVRLLTQENDEMRQQIYQLSGRLHKDLEYEQQVKYSSQLEERNKIAQEIHDRVGHAISGSLMQLEAARLLMDKDSEKAAVILQNVITILRDGMESIRATLRNIKPAAEQLGISRLKLLLDEFSVNHRIKTTLVHEGNLERISQLQWKVIYENVSEALTNALKYAKASAISVNIQVLNKFIKAEAKDNGVGTAIVKKGLGIRGMEERSSSIGGNVIIDGSNGFSVITILPLEGEIYGN